MVSGLNLCEIMIKIANLNERTSKGLLLPIFRRTVLISSLFSFGILSLPVFGLPRASSSAIGESPKEVIDQVWQIVYRDYLDSSGKYNVNDWKKLRSKLLSIQYVGTTESYEAIRGMLESLNDPYTRFLDPKEFQEMKIDTSGELTGVGIQLSQDKSTKNLIVVTPIEGTPAFKAGIKPKDIIVSIDGVSTKDMSVEEAVRMIRGKEGSKVNLGLERDERLLEVLITRARIEINTVDSQINKVSGGMEIGYIRLKQFNANASKEMRNTINKLESKGVDGYILDLRFNPGGLLESSIDIARQWINKGTIVSTKTRDGIRDVRKANGKALTFLPVVVLVNKSSASASEILSGAIQDNQRGLLVGEQTYGKGLVQSVRPLSDGSGLTVTVAKYLTPNGTDIHRNGIKPDVLAIMSKQDLEKLTPIDFGTRRDSQYLIAESQLFKLLRKSSMKTSYNYSNFNNINQFIAIDQI